MRKNISEEEKNTIRKMMQGHYFCLSDAIKNNDFEMYFYDFNFLKNRWGRFCEKIEIIKQ